VPSLSILDGWWIEGWIEGVTGWAIEDHDDEAAEAGSLYDHLERVLLPLYYGQPQQWRRIMRSTIALNGSFFNTQRMLEQYVVNAYFPEQRINQPLKKP
jgi:starch phosphorylase